eukprot:SAG11_NODE_3173_length_2635_cov_1.511435_3_plen_114_part_00
MREKHEVALVALQASHGIALDNAVSKERGLSAVELEAAHTENRELEEKLHHERTNIEAQRSELQAKSDASRAQLLEVQNKAELAAKSNDKKMTLMKHKLREFARRSSAVSVRH